MPLHRADEREESEGMAMAAAQRDRAPFPGGSFRTLVTRRHVDLLRVSSALCPGKPAAH
ncbi:putative leader peptide [Actinacidiphila bryophytorum]|uniref:putative leader peptide n=1 Tax=Actinacidiphila bryophytorum TaxID=1436133 RepID=UPI002176A219|nr:putative leader peptide [Actinacidiphila bryophytorum]UWE11031.1 hypothetical protein NYE86_21475 [Actinacidiphila bryophytorum]